MLPEITGQPVEMISTMIKEKRMRAVMDELNVDRQAFADQMQAKVSERVKQAAVNKTITPEQEKEILAKMELRSKQRELRSQLVEKGFKDRTITQEEAQLLMKKPSKSR